MTRRLRINAEGIVQGVGFRPFVYALAREYTLNGFVLNDADGVLIEVEGEEGALDDFLERIRLDAPPLSRIERLRVHPLPVIGDRGFIIRESVGNGRRSTLIAPDVSTCLDCLDELFSPSDRRYRYPFTNCTNCGPRFTIVQDIPYDRGRTTMARFPMCPECRKEYEDPLDRRFHAQPNACPVCGPCVTLLEEEGAEIQDEDPIRRTATLLMEGHIVSVKGLGGFHLACDAYSSDAVARLRDRKHREDKPFAVMAADLEAVQTFCIIDAEERELLASSRRPIVLLRKRPECSIAPDVAPNQNFLGVMLPYTPLHHLLLADMQEGRACPAVVLTSGNISDEPIAYENEEAIAHLKGIAEYFLVHDRDIYTRCDDSVTRTVDGRETVVRRSRGYAPQPIVLPFHLSRPILACGAELKNTFCLAKDRFAFPGHHIGDLENLETLEAFERGIEHFERLFDITPEVMAHDLHPEYLSTKYALSREGPRRIGVQHHHAHIASCLADNELDRTVIGVAFDGTGYGTDGKIWGGEFLIADALRFERAAHLEYVPMPGGEGAIKEPWRMAAAYLHRTFGPEFTDLEVEFVRRIDRDRWRVLMRAMDAGVNSPYTSSMGRAFDAVSGLLGVRDRIRYEGQAAIELEMAADPACSDRYEWEIGESDLQILVQLGPVFRGLVRDLQRGCSVGALSARFHNTVAAMTVEVCRRLRNRTGLGEVALSGGVFQNMFLLNRTLQGLRDAGFDVHTHHRVPTNDGGISLGQVMVGSRAA